MLHCGKNAARSFLLAGFQRPYRAMHKDSNDIIVVGAGVIGLASALALLEPGAASV
jgi:NADPH-dependent 2,4-dienoyl-CoA reductase/sulfur reductase-like enzyme